MLIKWLISKVCISEIKWQAGKGAKICFYHLQPLLEVYFKVYIFEYFNYIYLKHTSDILQVTSSILQPVELKKKKYTSSLAGHVHKYEASLRTLLQS